MKKTFRYIVYILLIGFVLYNSVYFKSLTKFKSEANSDVFDAKAYAENFFDQQREELPAIQAGKLIDTLSTDLKPFLEENGHKLGISHDYYFMVQGLGKVKSIEDENVVVTLNEFPNRELRIATDFIYGNAVREASGMAKIGDFKNTMDFNTISIEVNKIVSDKVVPPFVSKAKIGDELFFKGAVKINDKNPNLGQLRVIPLILTLK